MTGRAVLGVLGVLVVGGGGVDLLGAAGVCVWGRADKKGLSLLLIKPLIKHVTTLTINTIHHSQTIGIDSNEGTCQRSSFFVGSTRGAPKLSKHGKRDPSHFKPIVPSTQHARFFAFAPTFDSIVLGAHAWPGQGSEYPGRTPPAWAAFAPSASCTLGCRCRRRRRNHSSVVLWGLGMTQKSASASPLPTLSINRHAHRLLVGQRRAPPHNTPTSGGRCFGRSVNRLARRREQAKKACLDGRASLLFLLPRVRMGRTTRARPNRSTSRQLPSPAGFGSGCPLEAVGRRRCLRWPSP